MGTNDKNTISTCRKSYLFFQDVDPEDWVEVDVKTDVVCVCGCSRTCGSCVAVVVVDDGQLHRNFPCVCVCVCVFVVVCVCVLLGAEHEVGLRCFY